jgi:hypothetical protein
MMGATMSANTVDLWRYTANDKPNYDELGRVGAMLTDSFSAFIRQRIEIIEQHLVLGDGLVFSFRREKSEQDPLGIYFEGNILYSVRSGPPSLNVELFLFVCSQRVGRLIDKGSSLLRFRGVRSDDGDVLWSSQGMESDEFEEWAYIKGPQWEARLDVRRTLD